MKTRVLFLLGMMVMLIAACSSPEAEELQEYHNNYVETVNALAVDLDAELQNSYNTQSPEETFELQTENVLPIIEEINEYIESQDPESEVVQEVHEMRLAQLQPWTEAFELEYEALGKLIDGASDEEIDELLVQSDEKLAEAAERGRQADERLAELADEHGLELIE